MTISKDEVNKEAETKKDFLLACQCGDADTFAMLVKSDVVQEDAIHDGFVLACASGHEVLVRKMLKMINPSLNLGLTEAAYAGQIHVIRLLLQDGRCDVREANYRAVSHAINKGHSECALALLSAKNVDHGFLDSEFLKCCASRDDIKCAEFLLTKSGAVHATRPSRVCATTDAGNLCAARTD
jgi:hypothetical protein